ncbi:MAG: ABC transporter ATP-binding protein, partial [Clostridia bacterium]|nr:ABC transporter ATP-binding protein [Clostridia bacterium]
MAEQRNERPIVNMRPGGPGGPGRGPGGPRGMMMTREKPKNMVITLKKLIAYIGSSKYLVLSLLLIMMVTTVMNLAGPALQGGAIDAIGRGDASGLITILATMAAIYLVSSALTYFQGTAAAKLSQRTVYKMRSDLFGKIEYLPIKFTDTHQHGDIMSRMTNDVENVSNTISTSIASLFSGVITLIGSLVMMLYYSPIMTLIAMVTIPLTILASTSMSKFMRRYFVQQQKLLGSLNGHIEEMVTGYKTVMAYGKEEKSTAEFAEISATLRKTGIKANIFGGVMGPLMNVIGNFGYLLIVVSGGYFALEGVITVGVILSFIQYSRQFTRPINELANQYAQILTAIAGAERVFEIMDDRSVESNETAEDINVGEVKGDISFENVMFSYKQGEPVLKNFNFEVKAGQQIAIVGKTGSGKTTVVNLLTRF